MKERRDLCIGFAAAFAAIALVGAPSSPVMSLLLAIPFGAGYAQAAVRYHREAERRGEV